MNTIDQSPRSSARRGLLAWLAGILLACAAAAPAQAALDVSSFSARFVDAGTGAPVTQAGSHPDLVTDVQFAPGVDPATGATVPSGALKDLVIDLPSGFYGNPTAALECPIAKFMLETIACPNGSQVGFAGIQLGPDPALTYPSPVFNLPPQDGDVATFGFNFLGVTVRLAVTVRTDGDYGIRTSVLNSNQGVPIFGVRVSLWGVPADPVHDALRWNAGSLGIPAGGSPAAFLTSPTRCDAALVSTLRVRSWQDPDTWVTATDEQPAMTGCDKLLFEPTIRARPADPTADRPSGYDIDLGVPQNDGLTTPATPLLEKAVVTLPPGVGISPASAQGLGSCTDEQLAIGTTNEPSCPAASKIGAVAIDTPVLKEPLQGEIILGTPKPGQLFRLFLVARGSGVLLKLAGVAQPDPKTGQLTTTFNDTPQLPFSNLHLQFKGGARAPLANPQTCGTKTTTTELTSWGGPVATPSDSFEVTGCTGRFAPTYEAGTLNPAAGAFSPFTMTIRRDDGDQELSGISVSLPPGLLGVLAGIPQCPETQVVAGTCDASSQLGTTTVESGSGDRPLPLTGKVFLAGAYKGQPYSLAFVVRAVAGPFDLGTVIVRAPLNIDASGGKVAVAADPLPTILEGVPLRLRTINITLDRPGFMFNATNCTAMSVGATLTSVGGATATPSSPYHASGCAALPLDPKFAIRITGRKDMGKRGHPGVVADLSMTPGQAGLSTVSVPLPAGLSVDTRNLGGFCKAEDAAGRKCPDSAVVGRAAVKTPALPGQLTGPVYLVENKAVDAKTGRTRAGLPRLWLKLAGGGVPLDLFADNAIVGGRLVPTFSNIPDAPIASFHLEISGGAKGILMTSRDQCSAARTSPTVFEGQNGKVLRRTVKFGSDCAPRIAKTTASGSSVRLTVNGIGAGRLTVSGRGLRRASKAITSASAATITATLSASAKQTLARSGRVRLHAVVVFTPRSGSGTRMRKTVTIRTR